MWLENIGRTIGDIFGLNRKKREEQVAQPTQPQPRPVQQRPQGFNTGASAFRAPAAVPQPNKPSTVGQPIANNQSDLGDFFAGSNEKFLGSAARGAVSAANFIGSGFNSEEAEKRTNDFLRKTGQVSRTGNAPLAEGVGINRDTTGFKAGQAAGTAQGIATDVATTAIPGAAAEKVIRRIPTVANGINSANRGISFAAKAAPVLGGGVVSSSVSQVKDPLQNAGQNFGSNAAFDAASVLLPSALRGARSIVGRPQDGLPTKPIVQFKAPTQPETFSDYTDLLLRNAGVDIDKGLVKSNILYDNPITKGYNKGQQKIIETIDKGSDALAGKLRKGLESENKLVAGATRLPQVAFKNFGRSYDERQILTARSSKVQAAGEVASLVQRDLEKAIKATGNPEITNRRIYQVLETPEYLQKVYKDPTKLTINDLTPQEQAVMEKLIASNKIRNDINLATGQITPEKHAEFADGFHSPRIYDFEANTALGSGRLVDQRPSIKRKDITKIDDAVTDTALRSPTLASSVRLETALRNKANIEALDELAKAGLIVDRPPNKNYVKLEGKQFGQWNGKYIDKQIKSQLDGADLFNSEIGQKVGDLVGAYQDSVLGKADRLQKKIKTVFAPATNIGNISSNIVAFSGAANVNSATVAVRMSQAAKQLYKHSKGFDPNVYRAEKAGLFSGDTGRQLVGKNEDTLKTLEKQSKNPIKAIESFYGKTDQAAALGIFNELKARGLTDAQAVRRTHKAVQNYNNVGRGINTLADSPVLGKPFARFTPELLRIAKNNAIYNPVGTAVKVGGLAAGSAALSNAAGETDEERKARESAVGQTKLSGTGFINDIVTGGKNKDDVSLNLPINGSAVNIARASGLNFPIEPGGDAGSALVRQLSPFADLTRTTADGQTELAPNQAVSSMFLRPVADQIANRDFMGRQITDPNNRSISEIGKGKSQYENPDGTRQSPGQDAEMGNRLGTLAMNYLPLASEANALSSSLTGQKDYYGKERTPTEAALRAIGLKTESNSPDVRQKRVSTQEFYEGKDKQVKDFLVKNPEIADAYFKFNDSSRDRFTNKKSSSLVTPEKWSIVKGETSGKLFNQLKQESLDANAKDGKPVDPIFQVNDPKRVKELINIRSTPPGDNIEKEEILRATTDWYKPFEKAESDFYTKSKEYYAGLPKAKQPADMNDRVREYSEVKYPEQSKLVEGYYQAKARNPQEGKDYFKANADALSADFARYKSEKLGYINKKREILGLDPIKQDTFNNVTFGYEDDESKVAKELYFNGLGGVGRGRGGRKPGLGKSDYAYAVSPKAGGEFKKPTVTAKKSKPISITAARSAKPKVSIKKSQV